MVEIVPYWQNYIGGGFVDGGARRLAVDDPGTGGKLAEQALADAGGVETPFGGYGKSGYGRKKGRTQGLAQLCTDQECRNQAGSELTDGQGPL